MPIHFFCKECEQSYTSEASPIVQAIRCPRCQSPSVQRSRGGFDTNRRAQTPLAPTGTEAGATARARCSSPVRAISPTGRGVYEIAGLIDWKIVSVASAMVATALSGLFVIMACHRTAEVVAPTVDVPVVAASIAPPPEMQPVAAPAKPLPESVLLPIDVFALEHVWPATITAANQVEPLVDDFAFQFREEPRSIKRMMKRRVYVSDEELRRQLVLVPQVGLQTIPMKSRGLLASAPKDRKYEPDEMPDFAGLPMRMGIDCQLGKESAENLLVMSRKLRAALAAATPNDGTDVRYDAEKLKQMLGGKSRDVGQWLRPEAVPALTQLLMAENTPLRLLLVELLSANPDRSAAAALAQRALFDLSADVREAAVRALGRRDVGEYRSVLLEGFRYPWAPIADHAAEALVALQDTDSIPVLKKLLDEPNPNAPYGSSKGPMVREVVRINHLANCTMCHAASTSTNDLVRGQVPVPGQPLPPPNQYYEGSQGSFVRADVTYLQQDFSLPQPVTQAGAWPTNQRYDYLVRTRALTNEELRNLLLNDHSQDDHPQREAVRFALRELGVKDSDKE